MVREEKKKQNQEEFIMKPKVDFCFKELMEDEIIRKGFIAAVLGVPKESIGKTIIINTHLRKESEEEKLGILDVRVEMMDGTQIDMEIQVAPFELWVERSLFYLCKMFIDQIHAGEDYSVIKKCIHIGILDFELFEKDPELASCFHFWEDHRRRKYTDKLELHVLELPKLAKYDYPPTELINWAKFINAENREEMEKMAKTDESLKKAYEKVVKMSADDVKRQEYEEREKAIRDYNCQMRSNWNAGVQVGIKQGREEGIVKAFQKLGLSAEETAKHIAEMQSVSLEDAKVLVENYWDAK